MHPLSYSTRYLTVHLANSLDCFIPHAYVHVQSMYNQNSYRVGLLDHARRSQPCNNTPPLPRTVADDLLRCSASAQNLGESGEADILTWVGHWDLSRGLRTGHSTQDLHFNVG